MVTGHLFVPGAKGLALLDPVLVALELQGAPLALEIPGEVVAVVREGQGPQPGIGLRVTVPKHLPPIAAHILEGRWADAAALLLMQAVEEPQPTRRAAGARSGGFQTLERPPSSSPTPAAPRAPARTPASNPSGAGPAPYSRPFQRATSTPAKPDEAKPIRAARPLQHSIPSGARAIMEVEPGGSKFPRVSTNPQTPPPPPPSGSVARVATLTPDEAPARVKAPSTPPEGLPGASTALSRAPADPKDERKKAGDPAKIGAEAAAYLKRCEGANHYKLLNLDPQADARAIRQAYSALMMRFHPDNYYRKLDKPAQDTLELLYQKITEAYETLAVAEKRTAYDMKIGNYKGGEGQEQERKQQLERWRQTSFESSNPKQAKMAQDLYAEARKAWEKGRRADALAKLKLALQVHPHHVEAKALLAQAEQG